MPLDACEWGWSLYKDVNRAEQALAVYKGTDDTATDEMQGMLF